MSTAALSFAARWQRILCLGIFALVGCSLFDKPPPLMHSAFKLKPLGVMPDAIKLDIVRIERPADDKLLGPELWNGVDEQVIDVASRQVLHKNGFRVGVVGSRPPKALQTLLGLKADFAYEPNAEKTKELVGHRVTVRSGSDTEIQTSQYYEECKIEMPQATQSSQFTFSNARCVYKVTVERLQDGWARLTFVPQVQHGDQQIRHTATESGWQFVNTQQVETFFPQRFSLMLSTGEMAVITAGDALPNSLGQQFFLGKKDHTEFQRLLVVRLSDVCGDDPVFQP